MSGKAPARVRRDKGTLGAKGFATRPTCTAYSVSRHALISGQKTNLKRSARSTCWTMYKRYECQLLPAQRKNEFI